MLPTTALLLSLAAVPGFQKKLGAPIERSAVVADLLGQGQPSVLVAAGDQLFAYGLDGHGLSGFPLALGPGESAAGDLAAADMDGDRRAEVAIALKSGKLLLLANGQLCAGFPLTLEGGAASGPSFVDLTGDGKPELLQGDKSGQLHAVDRGGKVVSGFPITLGSPVTTSVSAGTLKGARALAVGTESGQVFVLDSKGRALPGFPVQTNFAVTGAPAFGDIDDDGRFDLVVASTDYRVYAVDEAGVTLRGFPLAAGFPNYGAPALVDLDGNGVVDVAFASSDGNLYAVNGQGKALKGFPITLAPRLLGGVAAGDLDRDGKMDLVVAGTDGKLYARSASGGNLFGFPQKLKGELTATPFLAVDRQGEVIAFIGGPDGTFIAASARAKSTNPGEVAWAGQAHDPARSGRFFPNPSNYKELALTPAAPLREEPLKAAWKYLSLDGDPESHAPVSWTRDGKAVKELEGKTEVPGGTARKGERWKFEIRSGARVFASPEVIIRNSPPGAPKVRLSPESVSRQAGSRLEIVEPAADPDGDKISHRVTWTADGARSTVRGEELPASQVKKGQRWTATVIASDGAAEGPPATAELVAENTPPKAPTVALSPKNPRRGEAIEATITAPAKDLDEDPLEYRYRFSVGGQAKNRPLSSAVLSPEGLKKGDRVTVLVSAFDGLAESPPAKAELVIQNTPPASPKVRIWPAEPRAGQPLRATVIEPGFDRDGDRVTYRVAWSRNGKPFPLPPGTLEIPAAEVKKNDRWSVQLTPHDGETDGASVTAETVIRNTPPSAPLLSLKPERPTAESTIEVEVVRPSQDPDGDRVSYAFQWERDGRQVPGPKERMKLAPGQAEKHEKVRVTATPSDGSEPGGPAWTELVVENAPPGEPVVALEPSSPTVEGKISLVIKKAAPDADGDALSYRYSWSRNGAPQPFPEAQAEVPARELRKGDRWSVTVRAHDGEVLGPPASATVQIANARPSSPKVSLSPKLPTRGSGLRALVSDAQDADGDPLHYRFEWKRNGKPVPLPPDASSVPREGTSSPLKGDLWSVEVYASDGVAESLPAQAEVRIVNTPPSVPAVSCGPAVRAGDKLSVLASGSEDADGDRVSYSYAWVSNGRPVAGWANKQSLPGNEVKKHSGLVVTVTPSDGTEAGPTGAARCVVENTAPTAPEISLEPAEPSATTGLKVRLAKPSQDRDGDPIAYRYLWTKDGQPFALAGDGAAVPPGQLKNGDSLAVVVTPFDGEVEGPPARAAALVRNTVPAPPKPKIEPERPSVGQALACQTEAPAKDADGEALQLRFEWFREDEKVPVGLEQPELSRGVIRKGEKWRCEAWATDGHASSAPAVASVQVQNTPPLAPKVAIEPAQPTTGQGLSCRLLEDSKDDDGDPVSYRYEWTRDGQKATAGAEPSSLEPGRIRRGETWRCTAVASDGAQNSPPGWAEVKVGNGPPLAPRLRIGPRPARPGDQLACEILEASKDPDAASVSYRFLWLKDDAPQPFAASSSTVPGRLVHQGERWSCQAKPTDGEAEGPLASGGEVLVQ